LEDRSGNGEKAKARVFCSFRKCEPALDSVNVSSGPHQSPLIREKMGGRVHFVTPQIVLATLGPIEYVANSGAKIPRNRNLPVTPSSILPAV
jgi:hypothetical protein